MTIGTASALSPHRSLYPNTVTGTGNKASAINPSEKPEKQSTNPDEVKKPGRRSSPEDCETCANRKYQDGSDEGNVSFKSAAHISPDSAAAKVRSHENEHVSNAYKKASQKNGEVINASVSIHTSICPECGRTYVSGGVTNTMIKYSNEENPYTQNQKALDAVKYKGANINYAA